MELVTGVKIEWNENNIPDLYEILPCGTPYVEEPDNISAIEQASMGTQIYTRGNRLCIQADSSIKSMTLYDLSGRTVARLTPNTPAFAAAFPTRWMSILSQSSFMRSSFTFTLPLNASRFPP